ncbi:MAG: hypothetical protein ACFFHD_10195 [Promethearchaeota archaeon]
MAEKCNLCNGKGKIRIYRHDIEEFEEIECPKCSKGKPNTELALKK